MQIKNDVLFVLCASTGADPAMGGHPHWLEVGAGHGCEKLSASDMGANYHLTLTFGSFYLFCYFLYTEWPFMCWCAVKKLLTHWLNFWLLFVWKWTKGFQGFPSEPPWGLGPRPLLYAQAPFSPWLAPLANRGSAPVRVLSCFLAYKSWLFHEIEWTVWLCIIEQRHNSIL